VQKCRTPAEIPYEYTDIAIIGGRLAGSIAAAMLWTRQDSNCPDRSASTYPFDFRLEKNQRRRAAGPFYQTGIADSVLRAATYDGENCIARFGYLLYNKPSRQ
jgi:hypothetical protein